MEKLFKCIRALMVVVAVMCLSVFFAECRKTKTVEKIVEVHDTVKTAWQVDNSRHFPDQSYMGAFSSPSGISLFLGAEFYCYTFDSTRNQWGITTIYQPPFFTRRPAVAKDFFVTGFIRSFGTELIYFDWRHPAEGLSFSENVSDIDTAFKALSQFPTAAEPISSSIDISDSNRVMLPIISTNNQLCFATIDLRSDIPSSQPQFKNFHKIPIKSTPYPQSTFHIDNRFFISGTNDSTFLVREDYTTRFLLEGQFLSIFKFNGIYYASVQGSYQNAIYKTTDKGESWNKEFDINIFRMAIINFDNRLIGIVNDRLWEVIINGTSIVFKEINNDGLVAKEITGIIKMNNRVYISTNAGLMYRPYSGFYDYK